MITNTTSHNTMCIIFIANNVRSDYPLIIAANRDEFHSRPTAPAYLWPQKPPIYAGKDLQAGGTWMGVTPTGYIAALTNIRDMANEKSVPTSRGELVTGFLNAAETSTPFAKTLEATRHRYQGYNLLYGNWRSLQVYNNRDNTITALTPGIFGLSNDALNTPWPKVTAGTEKLSHYCTYNKTIATDALFDLLADTTQADVQRLPDTGIGQEWEIRLSSIFIKSEQYGTRSSTLLLVDPNGLAQWFERTFDKNGHIVTFRKTEFSFSTELE